MALWVTHAGIILLLIGSVVTQRLGTEGTLMLDTGEQGSEFTLHRPVVSVYSAKTNLNADFNASDFKHNHPSEQKPVHFAVPNGGPELAVTGWLENTVRKTVYTPGVDHDSRFAHPGGQRPGQGGQLAGRRLR